MEQDIAKVEALKLARAGLPVFPLHGVEERDGELWDLKTSQRVTKDSGKQPKGPWKEMATTDEETIVRWFDEDPHMNYGVAMGNGWLAVDCDNEEASDNFIFAFETMCLDEDGMPIDLHTFVVKTGRGLHFYWRGETRNKVALSDGIDVRGTGGYVVGPGSLSWTGVRYEHVSGSLDDVSEIPMWLIEGTETRDSPSHVGGTEDPPTIPVGARNDVLFRMAANMISHGIDKDVVKATITKINQDQCEEPLPHDDLEASIFYTISKPEFRYGASIQQLLDLAEYTMTSTIFTRPGDALTSKEFMFKSDLALLPKPVWLIKDRLPNRGVMQMHGRSYTGKTFVAIDMVLSMMNGKTWLGMDFHLDANHDGVAKDHALYVLTEGLFDFRQRLDGWCRHKGGNYDNLIVVPERPYDLARAEEWDRLFTNMEGDERVVQYADRIGIVVIDTQSNALVVNENDNNEMARVASLLRRMSNKMRCPILLIHHDPLGGEDGMRGNRIGGRGAGSFGAAMDVVMALDPPMRGAEDSTLTWSKIKAARAPESPTMFRLTNVELLEDTSTAVCDDDGLNALLGNGPDDLLDRIEQILREVDTRTLRWGQVYQTLGFVGTDPRVRNLREQVNLDPRFQLERGQGRGNYFDITLVAQDPIL